MGELKTIKRVLYFATGPDRLDELMSSLAALPHADVECDSRPQSLTLGDTCIRFFPETDVTLAMERVHSEYFNLVILDIRDSDAAAAHDHRNAVISFLEAMDREVDIELRYACDRIVALVSAEPSMAVDDLIAEMGALGIRHFIRQTDDVAFANRFANEIRAVMLKGHKGKWTLCASGGGITGIYYELGVLKCLDDCLYPGAINSFDMYFGISAGAVVTSILASGYSVDEFMAALAGHEGGRVDKMSLSLLRLKHLNIQDLVRRLGAATGNLMRWSTRLMTGKTQFSLGSLFFEYSDVVGPIFKTDGFEKMLRGVLEKPWATNDFKRLARPLFIGATDQDTRRHVLFGSRGYDDVPISKAVQASMSLNPAFSSTKLGNRYYEDGAVTRTSNVGEAIQRGSDLVFVLDPLVPYVSRESGFANSRGFLYNVDQDLRSMSFSRFENMRRFLIRQHPEVSLYTFLPGNELRRELTSNPLDHRFAVNIWRSSYLSTLYRVQLLRHRLQGDLRNHGLKLTTARAQEVANRLNATDTPTLADFYPDGKVDIRQPAVRPIPPSRASTSKRALKRAGKVIRA